MKSGRDMVEALIQRKRYVVYLNKNAATQLIKPRAKKYDATNKQMQPQQRSVCTFKRGLTTVSVDTRLWKTKHPKKRFQNFRQPQYVLSTCRIEIHQSQPTSMT